MQMHHQPVQRCQHGRDIERILPGTCYLSAASRLALAPWPCVRHSAGAAKAAYTAPPRRLRPAGACVKGANCALSNVSPLTSYGRNDECSSVRRLMCGAGRGARRPCRERHHIGKRSRTHRLQTTVNVFKGNGCCACASSKRYRHVASEVLLATRDVCMHGNADRPSSRFRQHGTCSTCLTLSASPRPRVHPCTSLQNDQKLHSRHLCHNLYAVLIVRSRQTHSC